MTVKSEKLVASVLSALEMLGDGLVKEGMDTLESSEKEFATLASASEGTRSAEDTHFLVWSQLMRATVLIDQNRFAESRVAFTSALAHAMKVEEGCGGVGPKCFAPDIMRAQIGLAEIEEYLGNYYSAIEVLCSIREQISVQGHESLVVLNDYIREPLHRCGFVLGHDSIETKRSWKLGAMLSASKQQGNKLWVRPIVLGGSRDTACRNEYNAVRDELESQDGFAPDAQLELQQQLLQCSREWMRFVPYSTKARFTYLQSLLKLALLRAMNEDLGGFNEAFEEIDQRVDEFGEESLELFNYQRILASDLHELSVKLVFHEFTDLDIRKRVFPRAIQCALGASELLARLRQQSLSSAVALQTCVVMGLLAGLSDGSDQAAADRYRLLRDATLREILFRDPTNDQALILANFYGLGTDETSSGVSVEVHGWPWAIKDMRLD
jgi:hypothetical protein